MNMKNKDAMKSRILTLAMVSVIGASAAQSAFGFVSGGPRGVLVLIDPTAALSADGRRLIVTGDGPCAPADGQAQFTVSVLQDSTVASVRSAPTAPQPCSLDLSFTIQLEVPAARPPFVPGTAQVCAFAESYNATGVNVSPVVTSFTDVDQWCAFTELVVDPVL